MKNILFRTFTTLIALAIPASVGMAEGFGDLIIDRDGDGMEDCAVAAAAAEDFAGEWQDSVSERATMTASVEGDVVRFEISWADSADETSVWTCSGTLDEDSVIRFTDGREEDNGTMVYENSEGVIALDENGAVYWYDTEFEQSATCKFEKIQ